MNNPQKSFNQLIQEAEDAKKEILLKRDHGLELTPEDKIQLDKINADLNSLWFYIHGV